MSSFLPYYPYYVHDFDEDPNVLAMNLAEVGLYQLALNEAWKRGSIPADPKELAVLIRRKSAEVCKAWPKVLPCWIQNCVPGRLVNPRQEKEREIAANRSTAAADYGRKGAEKRWSSLDRVANGLPNSNTFDSVSGSESVSGEEETPTHARVNFEEFMWKWNRHKGAKKPNKPIRVRAEELWRKVKISSEQADSAIDAFFASEWARSQGYPILAFVKDPVSWDRASPSKPNADAGSWHSALGLPRLREEFDKIGAPTIDADWDDAVEAWDGLSLPDQEKAIAAVSNYDGAFMRRPKNFLNKREFDRPPRPAPKSRLEMEMDKA